MRLHDFVMDFFSNFKGQCSCIQGARYVYSLINNKCNLFLGSFRLYGKFYSAAGWCISRIPRISLRSHSASCSRSP
jgi:hypothetical protein